MSKKKIVLIVIAIILVLTTIGGLVYFIAFGRKTDSSNSEGSISKSKVNTLYSELKDKSVFSFTTSLDEQNQVYYVKKDNMAYIETTYQGEKSKFIIKDGNSYLLVDNQKTYYTYKNNETDLEKMINQLEEIKDNQYKEEKEKIENKEYKYEEYEGATGFLMKDLTEAEKQTAKTRFYFSGNKLVYIKTITQNYEELLKADISYNVDDKLFEIPSNYVER